MTKNNRNGANNATIDIGLLENVLGNVLSKQTPLKKDIAASDWLELKRALNPINNMITKKLTVEFIKNLKKIVKKNSDSLLKEINIERYLEDVDKGNVNANGYDFEDGHIVAEVKANIPYEGEKYGSSQKSGLKKDLDGLILKPKNNLTLKELKNYYRFLVVLDYKRINEYNNLKYDTDSAVANLKEGYQFKDDVKIIDDVNNPPLLDKKYVYIVKLGL